MSWVVDCEVGLHRLGRGRLGGAGFEGFDCEQLVDGGRLGTCFGEAVAGGERRCSRTLIRSTSRSKCSRRRGSARRAVGRLEQQFERPIELHLRALEVTEGQFLLAGFKVRVGRRDQDRDRIRPASELERAAATGGRLRHRQRAVAPERTTQPAIARCADTGTTGRCSGSEHSTGDIGTAQGNTQAQR